METTRILPGMCRRMELEVGTVCEKTRRLLKSRREMSWAAADYYRSEDDYIYYYRVEELCKALEWIRNYYYTEKSDSEEEYLMVLWESGLMKRMIDEAMEKLSLFHKVGYLYHVIIQKRYLDEHVYSESQLEELLDVSRSTYYLRLKEAIVAFGLAFCGVAASYVLEENAEN